MEPETHVEQDSISKKTRNNKLMPMIGGVSILVILGMQIWLMILVFTIFRDTHRTQRTILEGQEQKHQTEMVHSHAEERKRQS